jgi:hypothetical protein
MDVVLLLAYAEFSGEHLNRGRSGMESDALPSVFLSSWLNWLLGLGGELMGVSHLLIVGVDCHWHCHGH